MKKKTGKMILLTGVLCILSLAVCACGKKEEASDTPEPQVVQGEPIPEDDTEDDASAPEPEADAEGTDTGNEPESPEASPEQQSGESSSQGTDSTQKEQPEAQSQSTSGTSAEWVDSTPNLEGDIKELKDGQLTVVEAITEKSDNGGDIVVSPGSGDDSEFNKVAVTYDQNTLFKIQNIYDGGASSELSEATAADMESGQMVEVWGSFSCDSLKAVQICIIKVV